MITLKIRNTLVQKTITIDEYSTVNDAWNAAGLDIGMGTVQVNGSSLSASELNNTFASMGYEDGMTVHVASVIKSDGNQEVVTGDVQEPAKTKISIHAGYATIESAYSLATLKRLNMVKPEAFRKLRETEAGPRIDYSVSFGVDDGDMGDKIAYYGENEWNGHATIVVKLGAVEDPKKYFVENYGKRVKAFLDIEAGYAKFINDAEQEYNAIYSMIE